MDSLMQAVERAATEGGAPPLDLTVPESARLTVTDEGEDIYEGLVVTHWSQD